MPHRPPSPDIGNYSHRYPSPRFIRTKHLVWQARFRVNAAELDFICTPLSH
ncbi:hypothetical protein M378DRAFT_9239 [Amanita muscaria Koide BX008]|uniref:Uncharacterized protein n=1 Tax=Amanita muscaria (strain Koide BX008) TaxID=946122 RepID=A0A0C2X1M2_AMAMK|nr:hypothetical protein M378DRAFT_9239 [Amanita muscaria Koide BX008]